MSPETFQALVAALWPSADSIRSPQVFTVVDCARDPRAMPMIVAAGVEHSCLYSGPLDPALEVAAPWMARLSPDARLTRELMDTGWLDHWFILARARADVTLQQMRRHLRTLMRVRDESGRVLLFRFYDPRVLREYLPTCTTDEAQDVFGPIDEFLCSGDSPGSLVSFTRAGARILVRTHGLVDEAT